MKRLFLSVLMVSALCLPSNGQIREILDNGEVLEYYSGMVFNVFLSIYLWPVSGG